MAAGRSGGCRKSLTIITLEELQQRWNMNEFTLEEVLRAYPIKLYRPGDYEFPQTLQEIMSHFVRRKSWGRDPWVAKESEIEAFEREHPEIAVKNPRGLQTNSARVGRKGQPECKERVREFAAKRLDENPALAKRQLWADDTFWNHPRLAEGCRDRPAYVTFCKWLKGLAFRSGVGRRPKKTD